ncbi:uncharacterized protein K460DRAFT_365149, partial [Cucurbitaria berberidis CBS 394.84]
MAEPQNFNPPEHDPISPSYSQISRVPISSTHTLVSIAGQVGYDTTTHTIPPTLGEQCSLAFANVDKCLELVGATRKDVVQTRQYVVGLLKGGEGGKGQDPERNKRYLEWLGDSPPPPSALLGVESLAHEKLLYEI